MIKRIIWIMICLGLLVVAGGAKEVTVVDSTGRSVCLEAPVHKVVSLGTGVAGYIYALDGGECLVGRDSYSYFPASLQKVPVAGSSSYSPDLELIVKLQPDLVIADTMLSDEDQKKIEDAGIPVLIDWISDPSKDIAVMKDLGILIGKEERAEDLIDFITKYRTIVEERTANLKQDEKPKVFVEWTGRPYYTVSNGSQLDTLIGLAGGINIAKNYGNGSHAYPTVSPEWVAVTNPDVIIQTKSSDKPYAEDDLKGFWDAIISRSELQDVSAIKDGRVYLVSGEIMYSVRSVIAELYLAKWFHPELFKDVDPEAVHRDLVKLFYDAELDGGAYVYPT
ncbi:MAG: Cobalamin-binding protein precursor [Methanosaeta sp. PtaB.Bin018]|jgi:iron complex transport system substrate-binding protein|nr:ABC transporter substrate-binding protein [Methanothrix sp.]OPX76808.1 MAG: Cobalamin-binding protein precursor [Methanosaeta sp. PtaB.Bin018]